ncbi:EamA/RhaT family transporter [Streptacidiphilus pinicola]|uniref:EamA/RhaT family transporter n=1 Tax=Streptacidiphilus pinicola TaxID=2219663 RepID=A0A2X0JAH0_9ACTN|nr:DMT family transporter [Streptacidiphilus pinicola]RAG84518.1 EamA/RhaT family transporter [Streptacidiphilus pinicola]
MSQTTVPAAPAPAAGVLRPAGRGVADPLGVLALVATVCLWSAFALSDRALASSSLRPADAALIRFGLPALVLAPALWRRRDRFTRATGLRWAPVAKIVLGGGVPFYLAATYGGALTSAAFVGALVPGMVPLFVAALAARGGRVPRGLQAIGLTLIGLGALALVGPDLAGVDGRTLGGVGLLLLASGLWAVYTVGLREISLDPVASMGLLCVPTFVLIAPAGLAGVLPSTLLTHPSHAAPRDVLAFLLVQGVGTGICSGLFYATAIRRLGPERCTTVGSLSPVLTAAAAVPLLAEPLTLPVLAGTALVAAGVMLANRRDVS